MLKRLRGETSFVTHLVRLNLASLMEYRATFLTQAVGMFLNNGIYFVFWLLFFDRFREVRGYQIEQIYLLFAVVAGAWGVAFTLAGNANRLADLIAQGRLDYYLTLPRSVLPHILFSSMDSFTMGDISFAALAYLFAGRTDLLSLLLFLIVVLLAAVIIVAFHATIGCLAFFFGSAQQWSYYLSGGLISFSLYPMGLFGGITRLILFTLVPVGFVGAVPVDIVESRSGLLLLGLAGAATLSGAIMLLVFRAGLRRYESGSAINVNI